MEIVQKIRQVIKDNPTLTITDMVSFFGELNVDVRQWYPIILSEYRKERGGKSFVPDKVGAKERTEAELIVQFLENYRDYGHLTKKFIVKSGPHLNFKFYEDTMTIKVKLKKDTFVFIDTKTRKIYLNHTYFRGIKFDTDLTIRYYHKVFDCVDFIIKLVGVSDKVLEKFLLSSGDPKVLGHLHDSATGKVFRAELRKSEIKDWLDEGFIFSDKSKQGEQQYIKVRRRG